METLSSSEKWTITNVNLHYPYVEKEMNINGLCNIEILLMTYKKIVENIPTVFMINITFFDYDFNFILYNTNIFPNTVVYSTTKWDKFNDYLKDNGFPLLNQVQVQPQTQKISINAHKYLDEFDEEHYTSTLEDKTITKNRYMTKMKRGYCGLPIEGYYHVNWIKPGETENSENEKCIENICHYLENRFDTSNPINMVKDEDYYDDYYGIDSSHMNKYGIFKWFPK